MNEEQHKSKDKEIAREILQYLRSNPEAKDTLEGIVRWWLRRPVDVQALADVQRALSFLLTKNVIRETRRKGLPPFFSTNDNKLDEISKLLANL